MKTLLVVLLLTFAQAQPITNGERIALENERQMRTRYNEMLVALNEFGTASDQFAATINGGAEWPLTQGRALEVKADRFIKAWQRMYASEGWISTRKTEQ